MKRLTRVFGLCALLLIPSYSASAEQLNIAAASSMRFVLPQVVAQYQNAHPETDIRVVYGSSGRLFGQLSHGAPFHIFMSANMDYAEQLVLNNTAVGEVKAYAEGRLVLWWQGDQNQSSPTNILTDLLAQPRAKIAIASPQHAPYGVQSLAWLKQQEQWSDIEPRLVYAESVAQVAHFVRSGAAKIGILALALAVTDELSSQGHYVLVPAHQYQPLRKGMVLTQAGASHAQAAGFFAYMQSPAVRLLLEQGGFASIESGPVAPMQRKVVAQ